MWYYILMVLLLIAVCGLGLWLMILKYYWTTGTPTKYRTHGGKLYPDKNDEPPTK